MMINKICNLSKMNVNVNILTCLIACVLDNYTVQVKMHLPKYINNHCIQNNNKRKRISSFLSQKDNLNLNQDGLGRVHFLIFQLFRYGAFQQICFQLKSHINKVHNQKHHQMDQIDKDKL